MSDMIELVKEIATYVPEQFRLYLEQHYYARINEEARLERALEDPAFLRGPDKPVSLYGDHGVVHARDVAARVLQVLDTINGVLIPRRERPRLDPFMKAYGVMVAYLHDIGMADSSSFGRTVHAEYATQRVFEPAFDQIVEALWQENSGGIPWRLLNLAALDAFEQPPRTIFREMLAMANCHSKSAVPAAVLDDPGALRQLMQDCLGTSLRVIYRRYRVKKARELLLATREAEREPLNLTCLTEALTDEEAAMANATPSEEEDEQRRERLRVYADFQDEAFRWLVSTRAEVRELVRDVVDTLRAVRCADSLRQRGTVLNTSGGYEVFVDGASGDAVFALRRGDEHLFLLRLPDAIAAGEANVAGSELQRDGNLRITFHRGSFASEEATRHAAYCAALVVDDIQRDVVGSFQQATVDAASENRALKGASEMLTLLENVEDNPQFAALVAEHVLSINPQVRDRLGMVVSLQFASPQERARYLAADDVSWDLTERQAALHRVARSGNKIVEIDPESGFKEVKVTTLKAGETLIEAGTPAGFVYIPLEDGLQILPLGGRRALSTRAWIPVGSTGVIRGAVRNATITAERDLTLLMIPRNVYLQHWYRPHSAAELIERLRGQEIMPS